MGKLVIFDLDGTILDTLKDIAYYSNEMLEHFGYPLRTDKEIMQFIGNGAKKLVQRCLPDDIDEQRLEECLNYYNDIYTKSGSVRTCVFDGMKEVCLTLKQRGYKLAILTNKPQETTDKVHERYMADMGFDMVVGQRANAKIKPDPTEALKIAEKLNVSVDNTYFVGDGETDVETAINAKMNGVSVLWGYRSKTQLEKAGAKAFANKPSDLLKLVK
jgi:phosphoglycolate phosphatase